MRTILADFIVVASLSLEDPWYSTTVNEPSLKCLLWLVSTHYIAESILTFVSGPANYKELLHVNTGAKESSYIYTEYTKDILLNGQTIKVTRGILACVAWWFNDVATKANVVKDLPSPIS